MKCFTVAVCAWLLSGVTVMAAEYRAEPLKEAPPAGDISEEIAALVSPTGWKVIEGEKRTVCEVWPAKQWSTKADFAPSDTIFSPVEPGSLVGVLRFTRKGTDFRNQDIATGVYTLRYANQPVDGNHVGTFATRDFLLLVPAAADQTAKPVAEMDLFKASAESAGSNHPAIMPLVKPEEGDDAALRHHEQQEWWTLRLPGQDAKGNKIALEVIVVGKAAE